MSAHLWGRYHEYVDRLIHAVFDTPGTTAATLRRHVESAAAALGGRSPAGADAVDSPYDRYVATVGRGAHTVTDADVAALKAAGQSEDAIFEVTVSAAVGAALGRLERGLAALREAGR